MPSPLHLLRELICNCDAWYSLPGADAQRGLILAGPMVRLLWQCGGDGVPRLCGLAIISFIS